MHALLLAALLITATPAEPPRIVAHRGAMHAAPENTLEALELAAALGAHIIEIDVRTTMDGHLVVLHDARLDRTTDGTGPVYNHTLAEVQALDAGRWFHPDHAGARVPTLGQCLAWAKGRIPLLLDLKERGPAYADAVAAAVRQHGDPAAVIIGVRSPVQAREFRKRLPESPQLGFMRSPDDIEDYAAAGVETLRLWLRWLHEDPTLAARVRDTGAALMINGTLGALDETRTIMRFTPDWILVDDVTQVRQSLATIANEAATPGTAPPHTP